MVQTIRETKGFGAFRLLQRDQFLDTFSEPHNWALGGILIIWEENTENEEILMI